MGSARELIGQILIRRLGIDRFKVEDALLRQKADRKRLCSLLLRSKVAEEEVFSRALGWQLGVPAVVLSKSRFPVSVLSGIPKEMALKHRILPFMIEGSKLLVAAVDPGNIEGISEIEFATGRKLVPHVAVESVLLAALEECYQIYSASRSGFYFGNRASIHGGREPHIEVLTEELAVQVDQSLKSKDFVVVSTAEDIENIVSGGEIGGSRHTSASRVLVVDDEEEISNLLKKALAAEGYEVETAARGGEALRKIQSFRPDLVILDAMLPEVHGFDICQKIKTSETYRGIPVIMISAMYTGWRFEEDVKKNYGADGFMTKPFRIAEMMKRVKTLIAASKGKGQPEADLPAAARDAYNRGVAMLKDGRFDDAIREFNSGISIDPFVYHLHYGVALAYQQKGLFYHSMAEYEKSIELMPLYFPALRNLAVLYQQKGFRHKAVELWERAMESAPDEETRKTIREGLIKLL